MTQTLYPVARNPYYIVAPPYVRTSSGIKAFHLLCHALNRIGEREYMIVNPFLRRYSPTHPDLMTPLLTSDAMAADFQRGLTPITICAETLAGNPFNAPFIELTGFFCTRLNVVFDLEEGVGRWQRRDLARSRWWRSCGGSRCCRRPAPGG